MTSTVGSLLLALAALIASRKVHSVASHPSDPGSAVELTVKMVAAWASLMLACEPNNNKSAHIIAAAKAKAVALPIRFVP
jgi:hypothetical protein